MNGYPNMNFETNLDRRIFKTIHGHNAENPQTLMGVVGGVDASERLVLTHDELSGGLERLVNAGHIAEIKHHRYCDAWEGDLSNSFSGLTESDHATAVAEYQEWFQRQLNELDDEPGEDDFIWQKLVLQWATSDERWPTDEDEDGAEKLADEIGPIIEQSGLGHVNGYEHGHGQINVLIFGKATDSDVDEIYDLLAPTFREFNCPPGSRIVRFYNERDEELESDIVTKNAT